MGARGSHLTSHFTSQGCLRHHGRLHLAAGGCLWVSCCRSLHGVIHLTHSRMGWTTLLILNALNWGGWLGWENFVSRCCQRVDEHHPDSQTLLSEKAFPPHEMSNGFAKRSFGEQVSSWEWVHLHIHSPSEVDLMVNLLPRNQELISVTFPFNTFFFS